MAALERLRASNPQPAMVSRLDLHLEDPGEGPSQPRECCSCRDLGKKNRELEAQVAVLKARVRRYKTPPAAAANLLLRGAHTPPAAAAKFHLLLRAHTPPAAAANLLLLRAHTPPAAAANLLLRAHTLGPMGLCGHVALVLTMFCFLLLGKNPLNKKQKVLLKAIAPYFKGRNRGSKLKDVLLGTSLDSYVQDYADFVFCPEGTQKMQENAVSKASRAKIFLKFLQLGWPSINHWTWEFLFNLPLIKIYPSILRKVGLAPTTVILYVGQAISSLEFFRSTPPKLHRDLGRTVLGHQALVKQGKGLKLIPREDLARCQALARAKMPSLLEDIEKAVVQDLAPPPLQGRPNESLFFFTSLGRGEAKDLVRYFRMAWAEIGLKGAPSIMDVRTAVSTYNFESNDTEVRQNLSSFMCHSASTQERFYALHKNLKRAKQIRDLFVCLALEEDKTAAPAAAPPAGPGEVEGDSKAEKPKKMAAAIS